MAEATTVLAGDIGGTKTVLCLVSLEHGPRDPLLLQTFASGNYSSLEAIVREFLAGRRANVVYACFGVAGPVVNNRAQITNLPWIVDGHTLSWELGGAPVCLLNDLQAIAEAIPILEPGDLETLNVGRPEEHGALAVVAPGTGLGEGFLVWTGDRYTAFPSEGGHSDFAPMTPTELDLLRYLLSRYDHVSYERVCSGKGLPNIYAFLRDTGRAGEPVWLQQKLAAAEDQTPIIVQAAMNNEADICIATLDLFVSILGGEAGNMALKVLATGGVYIGGGIPTHIVPKLKQPLFMEAFTNKGRLSGLLKKIPVHVILTPQAAIIGAARYGLMAQEHV